MPRSAPGTCVHSPGIAPTCATPSFARCPVRLPLPRAPFRRRALPPRSLAAWSRTGRPLAAPPPAGVRPGPRPASPAPAAPDRVPALVQAVVGGDPIDERKGRIDRDERFRRREGLPEHLLRGVARGL